MKISIPISIIMILFLSCSTNRKELNVEQAKIKVEQDWHTKLKGRWILSEYFEEIKATRELWNGIHYPSSYCAEIEIKDSSIIAKGYHEKFEMDFIQISHSKYKTTFPSQFFTINLDTILNSIHVEMIRNNKTEWSYTYNRMRPNTQFDITNLEGMINSNCLEGKYINLLTNDSIKILENKLGKLPYKPITDYFNVCGTKNLMQIELDQTTICSWEWSSDTLSIYALERTFEIEGSITYKKRKKIKELKLITQGPMKSRNFNN